MADSPFIPIISTKIDSMNIYVQSKPSSDNPQQTSVGNSQQGTVINNYPLTAEQAVRDLQMKGYFADIQKTVDEENDVYADELQETPRLMYLSLIKSKQQIKTITQTVYTQDMFGGSDIDETEHKKPKNIFYVLI